LLIAFKGFSLELESSLFARICDVQQAQCVSDEFRLHVFVHFGVIVEAWSVVDFKQKWLEFLVYQNIEPLKW
jgi:hypothetical protein